MSVTPGSGRVLAYIQELLESYLLFTDDTELPLHVMIDALQGVQDRAPHTAITTGELSHVLRRIRDRTISDITKS